MAQATIEIGSQAVCLKCGAAIQAGYLCEKCDAEIAGPFCEKHGLPISASRLCDECAYEAYAERCGECGEHGVVLNPDGSCPECDEACRIRATAGEVETVRFSQGTSKAVRPAIESKANAEPGQFNHQLLRALEDHEATHNIRLGMDYFDDALWYGMKIGKETFFISSDWRCFPSEKLPQGIELTQTWIEGSPMSRTGIQRYLEKCEVDGRKLVGELEQYFSDHAVFQNPAIPLVLAFWTIAGYLHMAFNTFPYVWINSPQRSCGKTRVLDLGSGVAFRGGEIMINPTPAVLYRTLDSTAQVLLIDEFEKSTEECKQALTAVLNAGFNRGAKVVRCAGDNYEPRSYHAYSPKALAGLDSLPDTLHSRTIPIKMLPRRKTDRMLPFSRIQMAARLQQWRDELGIWALNNARQCAELACRPYELGIPAWLDDRATDYMTPLFAVAIVSGVGTETLIGFCKDLAEIRNTHAADGDATRAVTALRAWFPTEGGEAKLSLAGAATLFAKAGIGEKLPWGSNCDSDFAGSLLRKLGFTVKQVRFDANSTNKGVIIVKDQLDDLVQRFPSYSAVSARTETDSAERPPTQ